MDFLSRTKHLRFLCLFMLLKSMTKFFNSIEICESKIIRADSRNPTARINFTFTISRGNYLKELLRSLNVL